MFYLDEHKSYNDLKREIILPGKCEKLAELFGILTGDGYIGVYKNKTRTQYFLEIAGHKILDLAYLESYISGLFVELFNFKPTLVKRKDQNTAYVRIGSKAIVCFFRDLGFPLGEKGNIGIPSWILANKNYMFSFLTGLFDTDGSIIMRKKSNGIYPSLSFTSKSKKLMLLVRNFLDDLFDFPIAFWKEDIDDGRGFRQVRFIIQINGLERINKYLDLIEMENPKHKNKINGLAEI